MLLGLYKLSTVNRGFRYAFITDIPFFVFSASEVALVVFESFFGKNILTSITSYVGVARYALILILTVFVLSGIRDVAAEVDASALFARARASLPLSAVFGIAAALELPFLTELDKTVSVIIGWIAFAVILSVVVYTVNVLIVIYRAYLEICMPSENTPKSSSGGGMMDKYWSHLEERSRTYAEYKRQKRESKNKRKK